MVKSMMEKGGKKIPNGKCKANGAPMQKASYICKVCGKEGLWNVTGNHIEVNHLEGICIPCDFCDKTFSTRKNLNDHKNTFHK